MSNDNYVGLHGRSPFEGPYQAWRGKEEEHCVPEHWEDLNRGICPWCGRTVSWDEKVERWVLDPSLTVLVLTEAEMNVLGSVAFGHPAFRKSETYEAIKQMDDLNRPYEPHPSEVYGTPEHEAVLIEEERRGG